MRLNRTKSPGLDELHPRVIKKRRNELVTPLNILFGYSINNNQVPSEWCMTNITAIFKKGDHFGPKNYRPVSLTSVICKLMEALVREKIMKRFKLFKSKAD